ncbi:MAG: hypothetical protein JXR29_06180 [Methylothermaceae bacterium]|nr:hypothetical protein [Methylothermaceae bacterium]
MKLRFLTYALVFAISNSWAAAVYNSQTEELTLSTVSVDGKNFFDVVLHLSFADGTWNVVEASTSTTNVSSICAPEHITLEKYNDVPLGATYEQAIDIIGCSGELIAEGIDPEDGSAFRSYHFESGASNFDLSFKNDSLVSKRQTIQ